MRNRSLALLSLAAMSVLVLAGCTSAPSDSEASPSASAVSADLCGAMAASGPATDAVKVDGAVGSESAATFTAPLDVEGVQSSRIAEGEGKAAQQGDYVQIALTGFDASTGEKLGANGYATPAQPQQISSQSTLSQLVGCAKAGSRYVAALPASEAQDAPAQIYVIDILDVIPADQWCVVAEPGDTFPTVTFDESGTPAITVPSADAPGDLELQVLEEGDGEEVQPGDNVTVNYTGVKWSDGAVFDSSWEKGQPATFSTNGVVTGFQRALEGQKVGSKVLVSIPPMCGYGDAGSSNSQLGGETLVFAIDIISTEHAK